MKNFQNIYYEMKKRFKKSWFGFLFRFTTLGQLLNQDLTPTHWDFFRAYINSWWWIRLWFRSKINADSLNEWDDIIKALTALKKAGIFNKENYNFVANQKFTHRLPTALFCLQQAGILNQNNFDVITNHQNLLSFEFGIL